jgi:hypothetical protein
MPITFEEVTGEIHREPTVPDGGDAGSQANAGAEDLRMQLERELRLMAERAARVAAD